jgi:putative Holliday junction resolvase
MGGRWLGIDYGTKRIGLALSDEMGWTAGPLESVAAESWTKALARIREVVTTHSVEGIVLGAPRSLKGHDGTLSDDVRRFRERLEEETRVQVLLWDERLSSRAVERIRRETGRRSRQEKDAAEAAWILQGFLDHRAGPRSEEADRESS